MRDRTINHHLQNVPEVHRWSTRTKQTQTFTLDQNLSSSSHLTGKPATSPLGTRNVHSHSRMFGSKSLYSIEMHLSGEECDVKEVRNHHPGMTTDYTHTCTQQNRIRDLFLKNQIQHWSDMEHKLGSAHLNILVSVNITRSKSTVCNWWRAWNGGWCADLDPHIELCMAVWRKAWWSLSQQLQGLNFSHFLTAKGFEPLIRLSGKC